MNGQKTAERAEREKVSPVSVAVGRLIEVSVSWTWLNLGSGQTFTNVGRTFRTVWKSRAARQFL